MEKLGWQWEKYMYQWLEENLKKYYTFIKLIKKKENGEVALYKNTSTGKYVIVKHLIGNYPVYEQLVHIKESHLPIIYETGYNGESTIILEEFIPGMILSDLLAQRTMSVKQTRAIGIQICDGLYALHSNGIVHQDLKPENVMLVENEQVKLMDFDAAKIYKLYAEKDTRIVGTVGYAAPEQYGEAQSDARTDIYAMGIFMNVLLTGKHPANEMAKGKFGKIIEKCTMMNPKRRYRSVLEVKEKLKKIRY